MVHKCKLRKDSISHLPKIFPDAPWHVRFERRIRKLFIVSETHPKTKIVLKSRKALEKESRRQVKHHQEFVIHPLSEFRKYWNIFIFLMMIVHQTLTPFAIGFIIEVQYALDYLIILDLIVCMILFLETLLMFRTGCIIKETNEIILERNLITKMYLKNFIPDLISCVPFTYSLTFITVEKRSGVVNSETVILMFCLFVFSFIRFNRILYYFANIASNMPETKAIILELIFRSIYW